MYGIILKITLGAIARSFFGGGRLYNTLPLFGEVRRSTTPPMAWIARELNACRAHAIARMLPLWLKSKAQIALCIRMTCVPALSLTSRCFFRPYGLTQKWRFRALFVFCRKKSDLKFWPEITPKCEIYFSVNCHLGMKFSIASKFLKCGSTHLQVSSEVVSFFMHFSSPTGVTNRDSYCSILCLSVPAS